MKNIKKIILVRLYSNERKPVLCFYFSTMTKGVIHF